MASGGMRSRRTYHVLKCAALAADLLVSSRFSLADTSVSVRSVIVYSRQRLS